MINDMPRSPNEALPSGHVKKGKELKEDVVIDRHWMCGENRG